MATPKHIYFVERKHTGPDRAPTLRNPLCGNPATSSRAGLTSFGCDLAKAPATWQAKQAHQRFELLWSSLKLADMFIITSRHIRLSTLGPASPQWGASCWGMKKPCHPRYLSNLRRTSYHQPLAGVDQKGCSAM